MARAFRRLLPLACVPLLLGGCTIVRQAFPPDVAPEQAWAALVAVAETPDYSDPDPARRWFVTENRVDADPDRARLEIYRRLDRVLHRPGTKPLRQQQEWRFEVVLETSARPIATFTSRGPGVPMQARREGERFFADVRRFLERND